MKQAAQITSRIFVTLTLIILMGVSGLLLGIKAFGGNFLSVQSGSMAPTAEQGDLVIIKKVPTSQYAVGDIITFINPSDSKTTITHRITAILAPETGNQFITKGDANASEDTPIDASQVIGKSYYIVPNAGHLVDFIRHPIGLVLIVYVPALVLIATEFRKLTAYYRRIRPYRLYGYGRRAIRVPAFALAGGLAMLGFMSAPTISAELMRKAILEDNTISIVVPDPPPVESQPEPETPSTEITCTNETNINVRTETNQSAESGDAAVAGNTEGGNAMSGNATNSSSQSAEIDIDSACPVMSEPVSP